MSKRTNGGKHRSILRLRGRGGLLTLLEKQVILTSLNVTPHGRFVPVMQDWGPYWLPVHELSDPQVEQALQRLHAAWREYIQSRFECALQREYCLQYFSLLDRVLAMPIEQRPSRAWMQALRTIVGFECFGVASQADGREVLAAGTTTARNPTYVLAKLKWPEALDDPQYLPFIAPPDSKLAGLYYHYRQYRLSKDSPISLLLHVAVKPAHRAASFGLVESLAQGITAGADPRCAERAQRLWTKILRPLVRSQLVGQAGSAHIQFVDIGAGSGALTAALCRRVLSWSASKGLSCALRVWSVDLCLADPARFFRDAHMRDGTDSLAFVADDYRHWLTQPEPLPARPGLRVGLVSKLLNNMSRFTLSRVSTHVLSSSISSTSLKEGRHLPASCLASDGAGPEALSISTARVELAEGRTFAQASLSPYYRALQAALADGSGEEAAAEDEIWLPLRRFDPDCLVAVDGVSVLARLLQHCEYVVVEDADLRPKELVEHLRSFSLDRLAALDMTRTLGLTGNHTYVLWADSDTEPSLPGEHIW